MVWNGTAPKPTTSKKPNEGGHPLNPGGGDQNNNPGGGGWPSGGGGGGSSGPTPEQRKAQANLGGVSGYNFETPKLMVDYADQIFDENDKFLEESMNEQLKREGRKANNEWYKSRQNIQSVVAQLADAAGQALGGSFLLDFWDSISKKADQDAVAVLNEKRETDDNIRQDFFEGIQSDINDRNRTYMDAEESERGVVADYVAQSNNIHPDLASALIDADHHTIKEPEWMKTGLFKKNFRKHQPVDSVGLTRPANSADVAARRGLVDVPQRTTYGSAANNDYWSRLNSGYDRRGQ